MVKIALDAGHGYHTAGKRTPDGEREWSFNNKVLLACEAELKKYENVSILRLDDPTGKTDVPLVTRTRKANNWKADVLVSIHHNANTSKWGSWGGVETFVYRKNNGQAHKLAEIVNPLIVDAMGLRNRGVKAKNLHMVRESNMPAILTEGGFMDSTTDIGALRSDKKLSEQGKAIAQGLVKFYNLKPKQAQNKPESSPSVSNNEEKDMDIMNNKLDNTRKKDMKALVKKAYDEGIFSVDHSDKVDNMTYFEAMQLVISYVSRK